MMKVGKKIVYFILLPVSLLSGFYSELKAPTTKEGEQVNLLIDKPVGIREATKMGDSDTSNPVNSQEGEMEGVKLVLRLVQSASTTATGVQQTSVSIVSRSMVGIVVTPNMEQMERYNIVNYYPSESVWHPYVENQDVWANSKIKNVDNTDNKNLS